MRRDAKLDSNWHALMSLCTRERDDQRDRSHPKLLRLIQGQIDLQAADMGFSPRQIQTREFRAEKNGEHIVRIIVE